MATRTAAVAGTFYPGSERELRAVVEAMLAEPFTVAGPAPKALIAPHAGYVYSGPVAATAYAQLRPVRETIRRVVLVGPAHRVWFQGLALSDADAWQTPLGSVPLDPEANAALRAMPGASVLPQAHAREHSLEVHVPFLQTALDRFTFVPLLVGQSGPEEVGRVLEAVWGGPETLLVVSTDLSHYEPEHVARRLDDETAAAIAAGRYEALRPERACGAIPVQGLLWAARRRGMTVETLDLRTSGDTAGPRDAVVGYGAFAVH